MRRLAPLIAAFAAVLAAPVLVASPARAAGEMPAPKGDLTPFAQTVHPPAPDYAKPETWAARPDTKDVADLYPVNSRYKDRQAIARADVFYINPTTWKGLDTWNDRWDDPVTNAWTDVSVIERQASAFNACCRVFAPRYRQAGFAAFSQIDGQGMDAYNLAYEDVRAAFEYYLKHDNHGRPFIIVGHSQGALMTYKLVADYIDGKPLQKQLIAAYAPGVNAYLGEFGTKYKTVKICAKPTQTGCLVSWNTFSRTAEPSGAAGYREAGEKRSKPLYGDSGKTLLCVNPLTFDTSKPGAPASANKGSIVGKYEAGPLPALAIGTAGAACVDGVLMADVPKGPNVTDWVLAGGMMHYLDVQAFYENIRENAVARADAWFAAKKGK